MTPRRYDLILLGSHKVALVLPAVICVVIPIVFMVVFTTLATLPANDAIANFPGFPFLLFGVLWVFAAPMIYLLVTMPCRITVTPTGLLEFKSFARTPPVAAASIRRIGLTRQRFSQVGATVYQLEHSNGKLQLIAQFQDQHLLFAELRRLYPGIVFYGC